MNRKSTPIWLQFTDHTAAINEQEALYVQAFYHAVTQSGLYLHYMEVLDAHHYRVIRKPTVIRSLLALPLKEQNFIFPVYLN